LPPAAIATNCAPGKGDATLYCPQLVEPQTRIEPSVFSPTLAPLGCLNILEPVTKRETIANPTPAFTVWIANPSRFNATNLDSIAAAKRLIAAARSEGYDRISTDSAAYWHDFWSRSFLQYAIDDSGVDYIENTYYTSMYLVAASSRGGSRGKLLPHFYNSPYRWDGDTYKWAINYHWNTRPLFWGMLASNHIEQLDTYLDHYISIRQKLCDGTLKA
jgi:hypothetical protein